MIIRRSLLVLALLAAGLLATAATAETSETVQVLARDNVFDPATVSLATGDTVAWRNVGDVTHTVTATDGSFDVTLRRGQEFRRAFNRAGTVNYYCRFHGSSTSGMKGELQVSGTTVRTKDRIAGSGRIETAVELSRYQFPNGADEVYLARSEVNPDALVAGALTRGPILLVPSCGTLPQVVRDELDRLDPVKVVALGGTASVCESMLDQAVSGA